jgi:hypothetical protein
MLFQLKKLPEIINLTRFLKSFWILYIDQIIVYNTFYSKLTFYIIKDRCQMHALKVFRSPVWLLLHKLSSPHYRYIRKMRHGDHLPLTQGRSRSTWREPPTMGKQLVNFTCGCKSSAPFFVIYKAGREPTPYW